jgi:hypothetical protein
MRRRTTAAIAAIVLGAIFVLSRVSGTADASEWWCWDDPVLVINGQVVHVYTGVPNNAVRRVTLADMTITVPNGVDVRMTANNAPRFPQQVRLVRSGSVNADGSIPIKASVTVTGHGRFDTAVKISQPSGGMSVSYGQSNGQVSTSYTLVSKRMVTPTPWANFGRK